MKIRKYFVIDFDSTFIKTETLDEFANVVLEKREDKQNVLNKIQKLTRLGMEGKISFEKSLSERMKFLKATRQQVIQTADILKKKISFSIKQNQSFFKKNHNYIYIVSGGFKEFIIPIVEPFGIQASHILANIFVTDNKGNITGYDNKNVLAHKNGKVKAVQSLHLKGEIYVIGDGYTDYQIRQMGIAKNFTAFTENVRREAVLEKADSTVGSFDEFLYINKLPTVISYPKSRIKVLLLENMHADVENGFKKEGYMVEIVSIDISPKTLAKKIVDVSILGVGSQTILNSRILSSAKRLLAVGIFSNKNDQINLELCTKQGVVVFNTLYSEIINYINIGSSHLSINFPRIHLPALSNAHRLLHLHRNKPGVLANINSILAKNNINILSQYLQTNRQIGYVITDVNKKYNAEVLQKLKQVRHTIRFRVLY